MDSKKEIYTLRTQYKRMYLYTTFLSIVSRFPLMDLPLPDLFPILTWKLTWKIILNKQRYNKLKLFSLSESFTLDTNSRCRGRGLSTPVPPTPSQEGSHLRFWYSLTTETFYVPSRGSYYILRKVRNRSVDTRLLTPLRTPECNPYSTLFGVWSLTPKRNLR